MQKVKEKLSFVVNYLKFCGLILEKFKKPKHKYLKFLKFWPFGVVLIYTLAGLALTLKMIKMFAFDGNFNLRTDYAGIILIISLHLRGTIDLIYTLMQRQTEEKFWNQLDQLDDFIVRFLGIKMNYPKENWQHLIRTVLILIFCLSVGGVIPLIKYSSAEKFNAYYGSATFVILMNQINMTKYIFCVSIVSNRLEQVTKYYQKIKRRSYKLRALPHVYSIVWKLSKIMDKRFAIPTMFMTFHVFVMIMFFGFVQAHSINLDIFNVSHLASIVSPQIILWILCFYCHRVRKIQQEFISTITVTAIAEESLECYNEEILLQMLHQRVKFSPKEILAFDYKLVVDAFVFGVDFAFIFIQFYVY